MALCPKIFLVVFPNCVPNLMLLSSNPQSFHISAALNVYGQAQWPTNGKREETTMYSVRRNGQLTASTTKPHCVWSGTMAN